MATITIEVNSNSLLLEKSNKRELSFLVSRVFEEYNEELQDRKLSREIKKSRELDEYCLI